MIETKQNLIIQSSQTDINARVGIIQALIFAQNNTCKLFHDLHCDGINLIKSCHAFWAVTKTKVQFSGQINWLDSVEVLTKITSVNVIRLNLEHTIKGAFGEIIVTQEIVAMDSENRKLRTINSIPKFPKYLLISGTKNYKFDTINLENSSYNLIDKIKVNSSMIDYFGHTNNIAYASIILGTLDEPFLRNTEVKEFEIHYTKETKNADELDIYKCVNNNEILYKICRNEEIVCLARIIK